MTIIKFIESKKVRTVTVRRIELDKETLLRLLAPHEDIPENAAIFVNVPGGGDWSNTQLDIDEAPMIITWSEIKDEESA